MNGKEKIINVDLIKDAGWEITTNQEFLLSPKCNKCGKSVNEFWYCDEMELIYCGRCNLNEDSKHLIKANLRIGKPITKQHTHYHIIYVKDINRQKNKKLK